MSKRLPRVQISIRFMFIAAAMVAAIVAFFVSYGPHLVWASKHVIVQNYAAMSEIEFQVGPPSEKLVRCVIGDIAFECPAKMVTAPKLLRPTASDFFLVFEDSKRLLQIPLAKPNVRDTLLPASSSSNDATLPQMLKTIVSAANSDFSFSLTHKELEIHDWSLANRESLGLDIQSFDRFTMHSTNEIDVILISAPPQSIDSKRRIRSWLAWESMDQEQFGELWFGDSTQQEIAWISNVATSLRLSPTEARTQEAPVDYCGMTDDEILAGLQIEELNPETVGQQ